MAVSILPIALIGVLIVVVIVVVVVSSGGKDE